MRVSEPGGKGAEAEEENLKQTPKLRAEPVQGSVSPPMRSQHEPKSRVRIKSQTLD